MIDPKADGNGLVRDLKEGMLDLIPLKRGKRTMENLLKQFKSLTNEEKLALMILEDNLWF